jgi:hypothetical protein
VLRGGRRNSGSRETPKVKTKSRNFVSRNALVVVFDFRLDSDGWEKSVRASERERESQIDWFRENDLLESVWFNYLFSHHSSMPRHREVPATKGADS